MFLYIDNGWVLLATVLLSFLGTLLAVFLMYAWEKWKRARLAHRIARSDEVQLMIHNLETEEYENAQLDISARPTRLDRSLP